MNSIYFVADTHFGDDNIRRYENRPFESAEEMDNSLIERWNNTVSQDDSVYVLGDFGAEGYEKEIQDIEKRLSKENIEEYVREKLKLVMPNEIVTIDVDL